MASVTKIGAIFVERENVMSITIPDSVRGAVIKLKGKDYLQVAHRLVWFRAVHPGGCIKTEAVQIGTDFAIFRAEVYDSEGKLLAQATKFENVKGFPDFIEKAETGSIGRALGIAGFGTQFMADELDEANRLADAPLNRPAVRTEPGINRESLIDAIRNEIVANGLAPEDDVTEQNRVAKSLLHGKPASIENLKAVLIDLMKDGEN